MRIKKLSCLNCKLQDYATITVEFTAVVKKREVLREKGSFYQYCYTRDHTLSVIAVSKNGWGKSVLFVSTVAAFELFACACIPPFRPFYFIGVIITIFVFIVLLVFAYKYLFTPTSHRKSGRGCESNQNASKWMSHSTCRALSMSYVDCHQRM